MSNTIDANFSPIKASTASVPIVQTPYAPYTAIATRLEPVGGVYHTGTVECSHVTATDAGDADVENFQTGNTTRAAVAVTLTHPVIRGYLGMQELNHAASYEHTRESLIRAFEADRIAEINALLVAAKYGAADVSVAAGSLSTANLSTLIQAAAGAPRAALMTTAALGAIATSLELGADNVWRYPGIDAGVFEADLSGADGHTYILSPTAMVVVNGRPASFGAYPEGQITIEQVTLPMLRLEAWTCKWTDLATRAGWLTVESVFGFAAADTSALGYAAAP